MELSRWIGARTLTPFPGRRERFQAAGQIMLMIICRNMSALIGPAFKRVKHDLARISGSRTRCDSALCQNESDRGESGSPRGQAPCRMARTPPATLPAIARRDLQNSNRSGGSFHSHRATVCLQYQWHVKRHVPTAAHPVGCCASGRQSVKQYAKRTRHHPRRPPQARHRARPTYSAHAPCGNQSSAAA